MSYFETFTAYDIERREFRVVVNATGHKSIGSAPTLVKSYSLEDTGEVLRVEEDEPLVLRVPSTGLLLLDIRNL